MARTAKATASTKVFGGNLVAPGTYFIADSIVTEETLQIAGEADTVYDSLQVVLKYDQQGTQGAEVDTTLQLNGCWRPRRASDGTRHQASGNFYTTLLPACQGKSFDQTRDYIKANFVGRRISIAYKEYPSQYGGFAKVPMVSLL
jgi:hypothetical protein